MNGLMMRMGDYVTPSQAARLLGLSSQHVRRLADSGQLTGHVTPLGRLLDRADVERMVRERAQRQGGKPEDAA